MAQETNQKKITVGRVRNSVRLSEGVWKNVSMDICFLLIVKADAYFQGFTNGDEPFITDGHDRQNGARWRGILNERPEATWKRSKRFSFGEFEEKVLTHELAQAMLVFAVQMLITICRTKDEEKKIGHGKIGEEQIRRIAHFAVTSDDNHHQNVSRNTDE